MHEGMDPASRTAEYGELCRGIKSLARSIRHLMSISVSSILRVGVSVEFPNVLLIDIRIGQQQNPSLRNWSLDEFD